MYKALLVSNSRFPSDPAALDELHGPKVDALLLRDALTDRDLGQFDRHEVQVIQEGNMSEVLIAANRFFKAAESDDTLLFYYSGHGRSSAQQLYLCCHDTEVELLDSTAVAGSVLSSIIAKSYAQAKVIVLDCCHSGTFKGDQLVEELTGDGRYVIAAASSTERTPDSSEPGNPSPFTQILVDGLISNAVDRDGDGQLDLDDLFQYISSVKFNGARPQRKFDGAGSIPIAKRNFTASKAAPDPEPRIDVSPGSDNEVGTEPEDFLQTLSAVTNCDADKVRAFRGNMRQDVIEGMPTQLTATEFLTRAGLMREGRLTYTGVLLFAERPTDTLPTAMVQCAQFHGETKDAAFDIVDLRGTVPDLIVKTREFIAERTRRGLEPDEDSAFAATRYRFPMVAIREIVANALVHRDYQARRSSVQVHLYTNRVEIMNPGGWGDNAIVESQPSPLADLERQSSRRNFWLAQVLTWSRLVEGVGSGIPRAIADCRRAGTLPPVVVARNAQLVVTIYSAESGDPILPEAPSTSAKPGEMGEIQDRLDTRRVAEIIVQRSDSRIRGTGFRISQDHILTAAHLVTGGESIIARFKTDHPKEWTTESSVVWLDEAADIALLELNQGRDKSPEVVVPSQLGRVGTTTGSIDVACAGYPRFKLRSRPDGTAYRDLAVLSGTSFLASNRTEDAQELAVASPPFGVTESGQSPWDGMSGAPVWAGNVIIGVINAHYPGEGVNRISYSLIDRVLKTGEPEVANFSSVLPTGVQLVDLDPDNRQQIRSAYLELIRNIAPVELRNRSEEVRQLAEFCRSDAHGMWIQAPPWSGKTALLSSFVLHPPVNVEVVAFFVTARLSGQATSDAFTRSLIDQLPSVAGDVNSQVEVHMLDAQRRFLLRVAATQMQDVGRQLILVIDGIDEERENSGEPSILSLLPPAPIPGLKIIISGRAGYSLPEDVPPNHCIREFPVFRLRPFDLGGELRSMARRELQTALTSGSDLAQDILGLLAASDSGLTYDNLELLTSAPPFAIDRVLHGTLARSLASQFDAANDTGRLKYYFAHALIREEARNLIGARAMLGYHNRVEATGSETTDDS